MKTFTCVDCKRSYTETIPATGHTEQVVPGKGVTCTEPGLTDGVVCTVCGATVIEQQTIPAAGHSYVNYVCSACGDVQDVTVYFDTSAKGWDNVNAHYWNEDGRTTQWPGIIMDHLGGSIFSIKIPGDMLSVVFNNGIYQTENMTVPGDGYICDGFQWVPYGDSFTTAFYVTGSGDPLGNWDVDFPGGLMTDLGGGIYTVSFSNVPAGDYEYKVTAGNWDQSWGYGGGNLSFTLSAPGNVTVMFNASSYTTTLEVECLHSYKAVVTAPTCTEDGYTTYTCPCGDSYVSDRVATTGHSYSESVTDATCTKDGVRVYTCSGCGDSYAQTIPSAGHNYVNHVCTACGDVRYITVYFDTAIKGWKDVSIYISGKANAMTLVDGTVYSIRIPGNTGAVVFGNGTYQTDTQTIPGDGYACNGYQWVPYGSSFTTAFYVTGNGDAFGNWVPNYAKGLMENHGDGVFAVTFANVPAGAYEYKITTGTADPAWGSYDFTIAAPSNVTVKFNVNTNTATLDVGCLHSYRSVVTAPTCTEPGFTTYTCVCGDSYVADPVQATGHDFKTVTVDPTCTEAGSTTDTCSNCGAEISRPIPSTGHAYESAVTAPTCTVAGYTTYTCTVCGHSYVGDEVAATGHNYVDYVCTGCGDVRDVTVYFDTSAKGWDNVNAHYWNEDGRTTQWPGIIMDHVGGSIFSIKIPGDMLSMVFNNGIYQTENMTVPGDGYICDGFQWVPYGDSFTTAFYVTGSTDALGNWDVDFPGGLMTDLGGGMYSVSFSNVPAGTYEYKVTAGNWDQSWGYGGGNLSFTLSAPSKVSVQFNASSYAITLEVECLHSYKAVVTAPTCTETGLTDGVKCSVCGKTLVEQEEIPVIPHTEETVPGKAATCTETGLTDGVICSVCGKTLVEQESIPANGHGETTSYVTNGDTHSVVYDCCGEPITTEAHTYHLLTHLCICGVESAVKNGIYAESAGLFYYVNGSRYYAGLVEIDGNYYYVRTSGEVVTNRSYWITKNNDLLPADKYEFDENGIMVNPPINVGKTGIYKEDGKLFYYENDKRTYAGLIVIDGNYYYVRTSGEVVTNRSYWITKNNDLLPADNYEFDENGIMVNPPINVGKTGIYKEGDKLYYYENNKLTYAGLIVIDGNYYYVRTSGEVVANRSYWITKNNDLLPVGNYTFDENGVMVNPPA